MKQTDELLRFDGRIVQSWYDMRSEGVWVILADNSRHITGLYQYLNGSEVEHTVLKEYLLNDGAWLSVAFAPNLETAMQQLEEKIQNFKEDYEWANDVYDVFERLSAPYQFEYTGIEDACKRVLRRSGVVQPKNGIYMLLKLNDCYKRITVDIRTLHVTDEEIMHALPAAWTTNDIESLLDEGTRFTTQQPLTGEVR